MTVINELLEDAANEARTQDGRVNLYTMMNLAAAGYELSGLDRDIAHLNNTET